MNISMNGSSVQMRSDVSNRSNIQNVDSGPANYEVGLAAMARMSQELGNHNIQGAQGYRPMINANTPVSDPQYLQQLAMFNLALRQQQQWPHTSTLYPQFTHMHQYLQQMAPGVISSQSPVSIQGLMTENETPDEDLNSKGKPLTSDQPAREKRTISHTEIEQLEAEEMDNDANTRVVGDSTPRKYRKVMRGSQGRHLQQPDGDNRSLHLGNELSNGNMNRRDWDQNTTQRQTVQSRSIDTRSGEKSYSEKKLQSDVSSDACQFARTRYLFAPFGIILYDDVRDKLVVEHLVNSAKEKHQVALDIAGYRRVKTEDAFKVLIFVRTTESFTFLWNKEMWPEVLCGKNILYRCRLPLLNCHWCYLSFRLIQI